MILYVYMHPPVSKKHGLHEYLRCSSMSLPANYTFILVELKFSWKSPVCVHVKLEYMVLLRFFSELKKNNFDNVILYVDTSPYPTWNPKIIFQGEQSSYPLVI